MLRGQDLLCGNNIIPIKGWDQISLSLKVKSWIKLLTLTNVAYISSFPLNFVFLGCLQKCEYDWTFCLSKIFKNSQIIGYTWFHNNNYKIGDIETEMAFATLASNSATCSYQEPHSAATPDIWHRKIYYIGPLGLHMLGKECLGVRLWGKKISQCTHYAVLKISQQVSRWLSANQSTRFFHWVYIDWLDLEDKWDNYQSNGAIVRWVMVVICEATRMAVTYFTQSAKESENLLLTHNLVS